MTARSERGNRTLHTGDNALTGETLRDRAFWHIAVALMLQFVAVNAVLVHVMPYLGSLGVTRSASSLVASAIPVISVSGRLGAGWGVARVEPRRLATITFVTATLGLLAFAAAATAGTWSVLAFLVLFGVGWGGQVTLTSTLLSEYFGRRRFGTIFGLTFGVIQLGGIVGPPLAGWAFDRFGSYQGVWLALTGLCLVSVAIIATTPGLRRRKDQAKMRP